MIIAVNVKCNMLLNQNNNDAKLMFIQQTCFFAKQVIPAEAVVQKILDSEELNRWPV